METVRSIERAFAVLRSLSVQPATLSELADSADLAKSTVARILFTLERIGAVDRDDEGRFHVAEDVAQLGQPQGALVIAIRP
ncbi:MAG: helix-turn-helix domain-containing protein, partial [Acidimicrobiia bacterium]|nr:helix-turn-helix domain-containing protein [Acidimicrobiia bacterium]